MLKTDEKGNSMEKACPGSLPKVPD